MSDLKETLLYKKVFGAVIGGAIGDALGGPIESWHYKFIRKFHNGRVEDFVDYNDRPAELGKYSVGGACAWNTKPGTYTDDTAFALAVARAIIRKGARIDCDDYADAWMTDWDSARTLIATQNSYNKLVCTKLPPRKLGIGNIDDNSSPMAIGPVGVINACNPAQAALDAYDVSSLYHDGYARDAASIIAAAVAEAMKPDSTVDSVVEASIKYIPGRKCSGMYEPMINALKMADGAKDTEEFTEMFYERMIFDIGLRDSKKLPFGIKLIPEMMSLTWDPREAVPVAIGMFYLTKGDFKETVIAAANFGRDCDSSGGMAGYIAGAFNGVDAIPEKWIKTSIEANNNTDFIKTAKGLTETLRKEKKKHETIAKMIGNLET